MSVYLRFIAKRMQTRGMKTRYWNCITLASFNFTSVAFNSV